MRSLKFINLSKKFGDIWAVKNITGSILPNRITGFIGPNGAGKTTLFHLLTGDLKPDSGKIFLDNEEITSLPPYRIAKKGVGKLFQDVRIFKKLTVLENVIVAEQEDKYENPLWAWKNFLSFSKIRKKYEENGLYWLEFVGLIEEKNKLAEELSFGQQKLLSFAKLMASNFDILLLDEPTAGLSPSMIKKIEELLQKIVYEKKKTIAIIEHNMSVVLNIANFVYFMNEGEIIFFGRTDHVLGEKEVREIYIGI
jgi:ABC-type branched-subunit amino acid transport system ATPase component